MIAQANGTEKSIGSPRNNFRAISDNMYLSKGNQIAPNNATVIPCTKPPTGDNQSNSSGAPKSISSPRGQVQSISESMTLPVNNQVTVNNNGSIASPRGKKFSEMIPDMITPSRPNNALNPAQAKRPAPQYNITSIDENSLEIRGATTTNDILSNRSQNNSSISNTNYVNLDNVAARLTVTPPSDDDDDDILYDFTSPKSTSFYNNNDGRPSSVSMAPETSYRIGYNSRTPSSSNMNGRDKLPTPMIKQISTPNINANHGYLHREPSGRMTASISRQNSSENNNNNDTSPHKNRHNNSSNCLTPRDNYSSHGYTKSSHNKSSNCLTPRDNYSGMSISSNGYTKSSHNKSSNCLTPRDNYGMNSSNNGGLTGEFARKKSIPKLSHFQKAASMLLNTENI